MKKSIVKVFVVVFVLFTIISVSCLSASALSWDGSSTGGGGNSGYAGANGYAIRTDGDNCIGYRFSVVTKNGGTKNDAVIDVFRDTSNGNIAYDSDHKFNTKYNKKQLVANQNYGFSTSRKTTDCYKETSMGFASGLPKPSGMNAWQNDGRNLDPILKKLSITGIAALKNGDKILVEPLYDVRLESVYHALTVTEIALYGKHILGADSNGGSSPTPESWGFISNYTNRHYPNALYTPDGQGLWDGVGTLSSRATFRTIINKGYGVGIAYTETKPDFTPNLSVKCCEAWKGSKSVRSFRYGTSTGSSFGNYTYANGYPMMNDTVWFALNFPAESQNCYVRQSVRIEGGGSTSRNVWSNSNTWYDVALNPTTVNAGRDSYKVIARVDWLDEKGNVQKWGIEKTFYIPVRPKINRYQVTMYSVSGDVAAYDGDAGSSGSIYYGQRVYPKYTFTSDNTWTSYNNFSGTMYEWKNNKWTELLDMQTYNAGISKSSSYNKYSKCYPYTVPDNSANTNGTNRIPVLFASEWTSDKSHTYQSRWVDIPIVKADAEITAIRLIDENGYYLDPTDLEAGDRVTVQYTYKNNTTCTIYVNGYNNDRSRISGIYAIKPGKTVNVKGYTFDVPNKRSFSIWGGVYLENAGLYNTSYETNRNNNTMTLQCEVNPPLRIYPISPNADYREGTWVVSSFWVQNSYRDDYIPSDKVTARFRVYKSDGAVVAVNTKSYVVVPGNDKNLLYFKWLVPTGLNYDTITITASVMQGGKSYNSYTRSYSTIPYTISSTPDTQFEKAIPSGFSKPTVPTESFGNATWWEYQYTDGKFKKMNYGIGVSHGGTKAINPATGSTAIQQGSQWTMKSGYGISLQVYNCFVGLSGYNFPPTAMHTDVQYGYAAFPEYAYSSINGKYRTLEKVGGYWSFRQNGSYGRVHFTPLWYPDGGYTVKVVKRDCWTPSGMLSEVVPTTTITIKDSAYDDWYVGRK